MLFVDEELEETRPIFPQPKRVRPKMDDDVARRIKCMLGEYVTEDDYSPEEKNSMEPMIKYDKPRITIIKIQNNLENIFHEKQKQTSNASEIIREKERNLNLPEKTNIVSNGSEIIREERNSDEGFHETPKQITNGSIIIREDNSFKEAILSDTKETGDTVNDQNSGIEETSVNSRRCSLKRQCKDKISLLDYNPMLTIRTLKRPRLSSSSKGKTIDISNISSLKKYPDVQSIDCLSEVPDQNPLPVLDSSAPRNTYTISTAQNTETKGMISKLKESSKKSSKKKKKRKFRHESLAISEKTALLSSNEESRKNSIDSEDGPCQIKNGVIKIRLSKLIDKNDSSKSDYGVSFCERNILPPLKKFSVPLSPLTPDIFSEKYSKYGNNHSSKRASKRLKKHTNRLNNNELKNKPSDICQKAKPDFDTNMNLRCNADEVDVSETNFEENINTEFSKISNKAELVQFAKDSSSKQPDSELPILQNSTLENKLVSLVSSNESDSPDSKIMCSINLSLINRLPKHSDSPNDHSDKEMAKDVLKDLLDNTDAGNVADTQETFGLDNKDTCLIKKEKFTPTSYLKENENHSLKNKTYSHPISHEPFSQEDSCPNLTPAYSYETEDKCNIMSYDNVTNSQESPLCKATPSLTSENEKVASAKSSTLYPYPQLNKIKIEVPDAILSNHERWNEYKEYKWCRDFTDVSYKNGSAIFKEQIAYNAHGLWQDPELKNSTPELVFNRRQEPVFGSICTGSPSISKELEFIEIFI